MRARRISAFIVNNDPERLCASAQGKPGLLIAGVATTRSGVHANQVSRVGQERRLMAACARIPAPEYPETVRAAAPDYLIDAMPALTPIVLK